jgi:fatty acid desaturase
MSDRRRTLQLLSDAFFVLIIFVVALFAFFVALGALKPGQVIGLSVTIAVLAALWVGHAVWIARHTSGGRDPATIRARERRGF